MADRSAERRGWTGHRLAAVAREKIGGEDMRSGSAGSVSFPRGLTRYQWTIVFVFWLGWALDAPIPGCSRSC
jgi:hypothetical protein